MTKYFLTLSTLIISLLGSGEVDALAQQQKTNSTHETIKSLLDNSILSQSAVSICAVKGDGERIVDINSSMMLVPASNMKLISTGAAGSTR